MDFPVLSTSNYILDQVTTADAVWMLELFQDPDVKRFLPGLQLFSSDIDAVVKFIDNISNAFNDNRGILWKITDGKEGLGIVFIIDMEEKPKISYALFPKYRKKGIMTECLDVIVDHFRKISQLELYCQIDVGNNSAKHFVNKIKNKYDKINFEFK